jgi:hypothetical protein
MKLKTVFIRFYKSFNFDHLRKAHPRATPKPWEMIDDLWFPYVEISIDPLVTTVVGANESGKSHLLSAIEKGVTGQGFAQRDLCRYSPFFNVEKGKTIWPNIGTEWTEVSKEEAAHIRVILGIEGPAFDRFLLFRTAPVDLTVYLPGESGELVARQVPKDAASKLQDCLPRPFRIKPEVALPNSVPLAWLASAPDTAPTAVPSKRMRSKWLDSYPLNWHLEKIPFARAVVRLCESCSDETLKADIDAFISRMKELFKVLNKARRLAELDARKETTGGLVDRHQTLFFRDYPQHATREQATIFLDGLQDLLDDSAEADVVKAEIARLRRDFNVDEEPALAVPRYADFRSRVENLKRSYLFADVDSAQAGH